MAVTLKEVANAAGYNQTTVSLVLNNHPNSRKFTEAARTAIRNAALQLGYYPNAAARALVMKKTGNIAFVISDHIEGQWTNPFYSAFLNGINRECLKRQYNLVTFCCGADDADQFIFPRGLAERGVDGIILANCINPLIIKKFVTLGIPCVVVGFSPEGDLNYDEVPAFSPDIAQGLLFAVEYLFRCNHRRVMVMNSGRHSSPEISHRLDRKLENDNFAKQMRIEYFYTSDSRCDSSSAQLFIDKYFRIPEPERPTALITNPQTCLGILRELTAYRIKCPDDLSLISLYDYDYFEYSSPRLTALKYDNDKVAEQATQELIGKIENGSCKLNPQTFFPVSLCVRDSCRTL